jgi:hypothetical protein
MSERLARCNGTVAVATPRGIGLVEQGGGWIVTAIFVCGLIGLLLGVAGVALLISGFLFALGMVAGSALGITLAVLLIKRKRRMATAPLPAPWLEIDLQARVIVRHGRPPLPLDHMRLQRVFQAGSSSKALALRGAEKIVIARGNPFGDEVDDLERVLRGAGVA